MQTTIFSAPSCSDYDPNAMPVDAARAFIKNYLTPVNTTEVLGIRASLGRVLAADIISPFNVPAFDNSAMDGYAFNAAQYSGGALTIVGTAFAGKPYVGVVNAHECVRIMTGAVLPSGCDAVIVQERVTILNDAITFTDAPKTGANIRYAGDDLMASKVVFAAGHLVKPADLGLMASLGFAEVSVYRKLKVAFFSTGDELVSVGKPLEIGQIYDSNRYTLYGMLARLNVEIIDMGVVSDDPIALENALLNASKHADVILTSGGVSVGEADYMKMLLEKLGEVLFWKISMKPGRPLAFGKIGNAHYFGLPGNPVAVMVTFYQFVREAMLMLMGQPEPESLPLLKANCTTMIKKMPGRTEFQRGILYPENGDWVVRPIGNQSSGVLSSMSEANCFIVLPTDVGNIEAGASVQVQLFHGVI